LQDFRQTTMNDSPRVLIVDDDPSIRILLAEVVRREGGTPVVAVSGVEGMAALNGLRGRISLVLLDLSMPEMDGFAFRDLQLEDPELARIPTVVLTGYCLSADELSFMKPAAVLLKPARLGAIRDVIRRFAIPSAANVLTERR
jgi:CheY-like chemotaxis protein